MGVKRGSGISGKYFSNNKLVAQISEAKRWLKALGWGSLMSTSFNEIPTPGREYCFPKGQFKTGMGFWCS